jgi:hypothetical protein
MKIVSTGMAIQRRAKTERSFRHSKVKSSMAAVKNHGRGITYVLLNTPNFSSYSDEISTVVCVNLVVAWQQSKWWDKGNTMLVTSADGGT